MSNRLSIVLFSGTVDKLMAAAVVASGAAAMQKQVTIFATFYGLLAFRKGDWKENRRLSKDFEDYGPTFFHAMETKKVPNWLETLQTAKEIGDLTVKGCALMMDLTGVKLEDLEPIVTEIAGVGQFIEEASDGQILFL